MTPVQASLEPADWPLRHLVLPLLETAARRLDLAGELAAITLVLDAPAPDERAWLHVTGSAPRRCLTIWLHPDQFLQERPARPRAGRDCRDWELGLAPPDASPPAAADFSLPKAQRTVYQQLLLVRDLLAGSLQPQAVDPQASEAFQEAWLVTVDGRLQRAGLPHHSAAERRLRFVRVFAPAGVLTPRHWTIFNQLWDDDYPVQATVLARIRALPQLRRWRGG